MEADWDLLAVVRGCSSSSSSTAAATTTAKTTTVTSPPAPIPQQPPPPKPEAEPTYETRSYGSESLQDLYKPFFPNLKYPTSAPRSAAAGDFPRLPEKQPKHITPPNLLQPPQQILFRPQLQQPQQILFQQQPQRINLCAPTSTTVANPPTQHRAKKRKTLLKKVCHVPAEGLSSDMWAWRKYGQKPIKGSPYPRGYYRCSSSKGCLARKQVERNRSDPKMFVVTYTSEHNHPMPTHRNSLAGSTRNKPAAGNDHQGSSSPTASLSPTNTEKADMAKDDSGNEMEFPDMLLTDDFFAGFEDLEDTEVGDALSDPVQESLEVEFPWMSGGGGTSSAAAAAGGS